MTEAELKRRRVPEARHHTSDLALGSDLSVLAAKKEKRLARMDFGSVDLGDKNRVISGQIGGDDRTRQLREGPIDNWYTLLHPAVANAQALLRSGIERTLGEVLRPSLLVHFQHADAEMPVFLEHGQQTRAMVDANKHQRRVQRNGSERVCGHAVHLPRGALSGATGDAGNEMSQGLAESFSRVR